MGSFQAIHGGVVFLTILLSVPIAFNVGGRAYGLGFSLSLTIAYLISSYLILAAPGQCQRRIVVHCLRVSVQWLLIPVLLIWSLSLLGVDPTDSETWVERRVSRKESADAIVQRSVSGVGSLVEGATVGIWNMVLLYSVPFSQLVEGACSLLVIQTAGGAARLLVNRRRNESTIIGILILSASIISNSLYFLSQTTASLVTDTVDAILISVTLTCLIVLGSWGIISARGSPIESSLLLAYVVYCIYQICTTYSPPPQATHSPPPLLHLPPFPPTIMSSYFTLVELISSFPVSLQPFFSIVQATLQIVPASIIVSFGYRMVIFSSATRTALAVRGRTSSNKALAQLRYFSPSLLVVFYTSLLNEHFMYFSDTDCIDSQWTFSRGHLSRRVWGWTNVCAIIISYALRLHLRKGDIDAWLNDYWHFT